METFQWIKNLFIAFLFYFVLMKIWMEIARWIGEKLHLGEVIIKLLGIDMDEKR